jgi:ankyrin repeat protein
MRATRAMRAVMLACALCVSSVVVRALSTPPAVVAAMNNDGKYFDDAALARDHEDFLEHINKSDYDHGKTAVMVATMYGHDELLDKLLTMGADGAALDHDGHSALEFAATLGSVNSLAILKKHGFDVSALARDGFTPLHRASWGKNETHLEALKFLVEECGVDVDQVNSAGTPATLTAVEHGNLKSLTVLLELGANANYMNKRGDTLLALAIRKQDAKVVETLLKHGANVMTADSKGRNMRKLAKLLRSKEILALISDAYAAAKKSHGDEL